MTERNSSGNQLEKEERVRGVFQPLLAREGAHIEREVVNQTVSVLVCKEPEELVGRDVLLRRRVDLGRVRSDQHIVRFDLHLGDVSEHVPGAEEHIRPPDEHIGPSEEVDVGSDGLRRELEANNSR